MLVGLVRNGAGWLRSQASRQRAASLARSHERPVFGELAVALVGWGLRAGGGLGRLCRRLATGRVAPAASGLLWRGVAAFGGVAAVAMLASRFTTAEADPAVMSLLDARRGTNEAARPIEGRPAVLSRSPAVDWEPIARPIAMFGLESPLLERSAARYAARRSSDGTRREDRIVFGGFVADEPHLSLRLSVDRGAAHPPAPFLVGLARDAAQQGLAVRRAGTVSGLATRFGVVETADSELGDGSRSRLCIAFRYEETPSAFGFGGWWCGGAGRPPDRQQLTCLIDRLDLLGANEDRELRALFARTELNRQPACSPPRLAASGRKSSWLDADGKAPPLRKGAARKTAQAR